MGTTRLSLPFSGPRLRELRERTGLTLKTLAERCNEIGKNNTPPISVTPATINRWENELFAPNAPRLKLLTLALDVEVEAILVEAGSDGDA